MQTNSMVVWALEHGAYLSVLTPNRSLLDGVEGEGVQSATLDIGFKVTECLPLSGFGGVVLVSWRPAGTGKPCQL